MALDRDVGRTSEEGTCPPLPHWLHLGSFPPPGSEGGKERDQCLDLEEKGAGVWALHRAMALGGRMQ